MRNGFGWHLRLVWRMPVRRMAARQPSIPILGEQLALPTGFWPCSGKRAGGAQGRCRVWCLVAFDVASMSAQAAQLNSLWQFEMSADSEFRLVHSKSRHLHEMSVCSGSLSIVCPMQAPPEGWRPPLTAAKWRQRTASGSDSVREPVHVLLCSLGFAWGRLLRRDLHRFRMKWNLDSRGIQSMGE